MSPQQERFLAIVNPAAGGGKSARLTTAVLERLREKGLTIDVLRTKGRGHAVDLAAEAYKQNYRRFIAVGGDGTAHEILNGVFGRAKAQERVSLGFLPFGTGNSFLRDFSENGADASFQALGEGRTRRVDLVRLTHAAGTTYSLNILSLGFTADVGALTNRFFKPLGPFGYLLGVFVRVAQLRRRSFTLRCDDDREWDDRRALFLTFNNSKYTGGKMLIAPDADSTDGYIEFVRWGPIGRLGLLRALPRLFDGTHIKHPLASRRAVRRVEFN
ncbi:MAG TPA: diacylglycerol kinase family protein, partial [Candidatus Eremiobacteraceae bacterium]|nr:diacylglycerol kinase family protein [Candidatus Eremiobacteraceae bacterium]